VNKHWPLQEMMKYSGSLLIHAQKKLNVKQESIQTKHLTIIGINGHSFTLAIPRKFINHLVISSTLSRKRTLSLQISTISIYQHFRFN
jgi:hypothetical protein